MHIFAMGNHQHKLVPYSYNRSDNYCNWVMIYETLLDMAALWDDYVQSAASVLMLVLGHNWCIQQPYKVIYNQDHEIATPRFRSHLEKQYLTVLNHTKMLSSNSAEKLSGPWLFFWVFVILSMFLVPPFVWGGFQILWFFWCPW